MRLLTDRLRLVGLSSGEYQKLRNAAGPAGARGGATYDSLLLACARKSRAEHIYTLNLRHFHALAPDLASRIGSP